MAMSQATAGLPSTRITVIPLLSKLTLVSNVAGGKGRQGILFCGRSTVTRLRRLLDEPPMNLPLLFPAAFAPWLAETPGAEKVCSVSGMPRLASMLWLRAMLSARCCSNAFSGSVGMTALGSCALLALLCSTSKAASY